MISTLSRAGRYSLETFARIFTVNVQTITKSSLIHRDYATILERQTPKVCQDHQSRMQSLSTLNNSTPEGTTQSSVPKIEMREFMAVFPDVVRDLTEYIRKYDNSLALKWFVRSLQYNVPHGKKNRGLAVMMAYRMLSNSEDLTPAMIRKVYYLGWCIEMTQSMFVICDDIMDGSQTRRGQPCWYRLDDVKLDAVSDALMIEASIFHILKEQFGNEPYYLKLVETFKEIHFITTIGQSLDLQASKLDVTEYTIDLYKSIVDHKGSYYTFYLPVVLAMHMKNITDPELFRQAKTILLEIGQFFQIQDDFLDCFGDPAVTGKIGTDIAEGKCTWLAVVAMQLANDEQKELMKQCYGSSDSEKVARIKQLYEELGIPAKYAAYEEESYNMIKTHIQQISRGLPHELFYKFVEKIFRRKS